MSLTTTLAPAPASASAMPRPIPRPAPVTSAALPSSIPMQSLLRWLVASGPYIECSGAEQGREPAQSNLGISAAALVDAPAPRIGKQTELLQKLLAVGDPPAHPLERLGRQEQRGPGHQDCASPRGSSR